MELINISNKYIALQEAKRYKTKKPKIQTKRCWEKKNGHSINYWGCDEKFHLMIQKGVYTYEYMVPGKNLKTQTFHQKIYFTARLKYKI